LSRFQNENRNHLRAFFAASPQKTGLSGGSAAVAAASRPFNPIAPRGLKKIVSFWNWLMYVYGLYAPQAASFGVYKRLSQV
jgi:GDP-D-mannose dehydratase